MKANYIQYLLFCAIIAFLFNCCQSDNKPMVKQIEIQDDPSLIQTPVLDSIIKKNDNTNLSNIVYNKPDTMILGETTNISLIIGKASIFSNEDLSQGEFKRGETLSFHSRELTKEVGATLLGTNFEIAPEEEIRQIITNDKIRWEWSIKPKSEGTHPLSLIIYNYITVDGKESRQQLKAFKDEISLVF